MKSASYRVSSPVRANDRFVARYSGQFPGFYIVRTLPLFIIFAVLAALYLDDEYRRLIFSRQTASYKPFSWLEFGFLLALLTAPLIDLGFPLMRVRRGAMALSISPDGITGPVCHMTRLLPWSEIAEVALDGKFLVVRRQPRSLLQKLFAHRGVGNINVPAHHLDCDVDDVLAAVHHARAAHRRSAFTT